MIADMLPFLQWKWQTNNIIKAQIAKWFKLVMCLGPS